MPKTVKLVDLTSGREIAAGGEGRIFENPDNKLQVIKVYHQPRKPDFANHLQKLVQLGNGFIKPIEVFVDSTKKVLGFSMNYVNFSNYFLFNNLFNKGFCTTHSLDKAFKIKVLENVATKLQALHTENVVIGDLNQYNLFFDKSGEILFVDTDSYQTKDNNHSGVLLDDIRDWTTSDINKATDIWAYDILSFWSTTYCHPFKWVVPGNKESLEQRVKAKKSILTTILGIKIPPLYEAPTGEPLKQFDEIFRGRRYIVNFKGSYVPVSTVVKQPITVSKDLTMRAIAQNVSNIYVVMNQIAIETKNGEWDLLETRMKGMIRPIINALKCSQLYPSDGNFAYLINDDLFTSTHKVAKSFANPLISYNEGALCVIEQNADRQWNFNIQNQLMGIDNTMTPVFAKSIIKRTTLIQNFGSKVYLNIPVKNSYRLLEVPKKTKDAHYTRGYMGVEVKDRSSVTYSIIDTIDKHSLDFDYLPHFACSEGADIIFVPEDGFVNVYHDLHPIQSFECPICTRSSKLFYTTSGMLLLENRTLYLLNTK